MPYRMHEPYGSVMDNWDGERLCPHRPDQRYTRYPCSCGRELWPPRKRGRGESLFSPRRVEAKLKALDALALRGKGHPYRVIAARLGYNTTSGAYQAVQRLRAQEAEWARWEEATGRRPYTRHQPTQAQLQRAIDTLEAELATGGVDGEHLEASTERLRRLLVRHARRKNVKHSGV
jgi:hypothetical protein